MAVLSDSRRVLLDIQGFESVDDGTLASTQAWLRFSPALCAVVGAIGTVLEAPAVLWSLALIAVAGAALPFHPFDAIYTFGVRRATGGTPLPANRAPRRFACALGSAWLVATGLSFAGGYAAAGYVLGASFTGVAALVATTHVCIPSLMFRTARGQLRGVLMLRDRDGASA